jgi:hypothetical protein
MKNSLERWSIFKIKTYNKKENQIDFFNLEKLLNKIEKKLFAKE